MSEQFGVVAAVVVIVGAEVVASVDEDVAVGEVVGTFVLENLVVAYCCFEEIAAGNWGAYLVVVGC